MEGLLSRHAIWTANGVVIAGTLAVGAPMTLAWVEGWIIETTLTE